LIQMWLRDWHGVVPKEPLIGVEQREKQNLIQLDADSRVGSRESQIQTFYRGD